MKVLAQVVEDGWVAFTLWEPQKPVEKSGKEEKPILKAEPEEKDRQSGNTAHLHWNQTERHQGNIKRL